MSEEVTKVIFRMFGDGQVIAFFPEIPANMKPYYCMSYMHAGQHGAANPDLVQNTYPAKPEDYKELKEELEKIGYNLKVVKKFLYKYQKTREELLKS